MTIDRSPRESYFFATRTTVIRDEQDWAGTTRNQTAVDHRDMVGLTRAVPTVERPRTWARQARPDEA
ncbi:MULTISPECIES: hypothetical protein [unclassified Luteococcus]|uniref:hypothetical protein n=1 Tax=unclassified Luteococcus TaxID=2639923 RepID=UPI00313E6DFC